MKKAITTHKRLAVVSILAIVTTALALAFANVALPNADGPLPPMTLTYESYGPSISVGDRSIPAFKETVRLEYRSETDWKETVIESPTVNLGRYGTGTNKGTWRQLKGNVYMEYDAMDGSTASSTEDGGAVLLPLGILSYAYGPPTHPYGPTIDGVAATTEARICFNGDCTSNAAGVRYTKGVSNVVLLEGVGFTLPLKSGDHFVLKSADIQAERPQ